jgi:glucose/arabinose dehydrogenase
VAAHDRIGTRLPAEEVRSRRLAAGPSRFSVRTVRSVLFVSAMAVACEAPIGRAAMETDPACAPEDTGISVPPGFCVTVYADLVEAGLLRHLAVTEWGDVYVTAMAWDGRPGGVWALRDTSGDGRMDVSRRVSNIESSDALLRDDHLYIAGHNAIVRFALADDQLVPGRRETVVSQLPDGGEHRTKSIAFDATGRLLVSIGSLSNTCQRENRVVHSPGEDPCPELNEHAGVWRFADTPAQTFADGERIATGLRNAVAFATHPSSGRVYAVQHGRDDLDVLWPELYPAERGARNPAEELIEIVENADYGWPYCYFDVDRNAKILAPEYGGDGSTTGPCATKTMPLALFPAHWAANDMVFYTASLFPEKYRGGAFFAFHGPDVRTPHQESGYRIGFLPFDANGPVAVPLESFAVFTERDEDGAPVHRPMGLAVANDGSLYVTDNMRGRIWRIFWRGGERGGIG